MDMSVRELVCARGGIPVIEGVSFDLRPGSALMVRGPNGSGKTTLFNIIAGNIKPTSGRILLDGEDVTGFQPHELFAEGLLRTFQLAHEFSTLTVLENLMMVPGEQAGESLISAWLSWGEVRKQEKEIRARALDVINFLNLTHLANELAGNLSGGQKMLV